MPKHDSAKLHSNDRIKPLLRRVHVSLGSADHWVVFFQKDVTSDFLSFTRSIFQAGSNVTSVIATLRLTLVRLAAKAISACV